jgi:hypothetical protein
VGTRVAVDTASSGDNQIVAAAAGKQWRILRGWLRAASAVNVRWKDGSGNLSGLIPIGAGERISFGHDAQPGDFWASDVENSALILNLSGAVQVYGELYYEDWALA